MKIFVWLTDKVNLQSTENYDIYFVSKDQTNIKNFISGFSYKDKHKWTFAIEEDHKDGDEFIRWLVTFDVIYNIVNSSAILSGGSKTGKEMFAKRVRMQKALKRD